MGKQSFRPSLSIVFFRAVNVGGRQTFQPSKLARDLAQFDIVSIGAAGTFVVRNPVDEPTLRNEIRKRLPFQPEIIICPAREVLALADLEAFQEASKGDAQRFVSVLREASSNVPSLPLEHPAGRKWEVKLMAVAGRFVLSLRRRGKTYSNAVVEKHFGIPATTRNWNTLVSIWRLLGR